MTSSGAIQDAKPTNSNDQDFRHYMGRVSSHSIVFFGSTVFNGLAAYGFKIYLAHKLGASLLGIYALGMTMVGIASVFNTLGISQAAVRFVSSYTATQKFDMLRGLLVRSVVVLLACNGILATAMLVLGRWIAVRFYHSPELVHYLGLFTLIMVLGVFTNFFSHVLNGYKEVARRTLINYLVGTPLMIFITVALVSSGLALRGYLVAQASSACVVLVLLVSLVWHRTPKPARRFSGPLPPVEKEVISLSAATLGIALLGFVMVHAETIILGRYRDAHVLGVYAVASAVVAFVCIILNSVNQIFGPIIADLYSRAQHEVLARMYQILTKWILGLTLPLAGVVVIFARPIMGIFGRDFEAGWIVLVIGAIGQLANAGVGCSGTMLYMTGRQRYLFGIQAVVAFMIVGLNILVVPRWGIVGAISVAAFANVTANLSYLWMVHRTLKLFPYNSAYYRMALPVGAMLSSLFLVREAVGSLWPAWLVVGGALLVGYVVFVGVALLFGLNEDDTLIAHAIWARLRGTFFRPEAIA